MKSQKEFATRKAATFGVFAMNCCKNTCIIFAMSVSLWLSALHKLRTAEWFINEI
jgi:hypothetical protein